MRKSWFVVPGIISVFSVLALSHLDVTVIAFWAKELLHHLQEGNLSNYAADLTQAGMGTNYKLFINACNAVWLLPLYLGDMIGNLGIEAFVYETWLKIFFAVINCFIARELAKISELLGADTDTANNCAYFYLLSPIVQLYSIGVGQVDCIGVLFMVLGIRMFLKRSYVAMSILFGFSILSKYFCLLFCVPLLLLYAKKDGKTLGCVALTAGIPLAERVLTYLLVDNYYLKTSPTNQMDFLERIFENSMGLHSVFVMTALFVCYLCFYRNLHQKVQKTDWLFMPYVLYVLFFLSVTYHSQWLLYIVPFVICMIPCFKEKRDFFLLYFIMNTGVLIFSLGNNSNRIISVGVQDSFLGRVLNVQTNYIGIWIAKHITGYAVEIGCSVLIAALILIAWMFYKNSHAGANICYGGHGGDVQMTDWRLIEAMPAAVYIIFIWLFALLQE